MFSFLLPIQKCNLEHATFREFNCLLFLRITLFLAIIATVTRMRIPFRSKPFQHLLGSGAILCIYLVFPVQMYAPAIDGRNVRYRHNKLNCEVKILCEVKIVILIYKNENWRVTSMIYLFGEYKFLKQITIIELLIIIVFCVSTFSLRVYTPSMCMGVIMFMLKLEL